MVEPQSFSLARSLCDERVHDNRHYVIESWWIVAPLPRWRQHFRQIGRSFYNRLRLTRRERLSVNGQWQETSV